MKKRWRPLEAWFAAHLRERGTRAALTVIALFCVAGVFFLAGLKAAQETDRVWRSASPSANKDCFP